MATREYAVTLVNYLKHTRFKECPEFTTGGSGWTTFFLPLTRGGTRKLFAYGQGGQEKLSPPLRGDQGFFCITQDKYFPQKHIFCMFL